MKFLVVTHVRHKRYKGKIYAYGPYVREMNLWFRYVGEVRVVAPVEEAEPDPIDMPYEHTSLEIVSVPAFDLLSWRSRWRTLLSLPGISRKIVEGMVWADHIHMRCPGNMGLLGSFWQLFFPWKPKTAKYAGNWDPNAPRPWSYELQRKILSNSFFSRKMKVLVYGEWPNQSKNIVPFFTASYSEREFQVRSLKFEVSSFKFQDEENTSTSNFQPPTSDLRLPTSNLKLLYVGTLSPNKRPLLSVQTAQRLKNEGYDVKLDLFGEGSEREMLESYIREHRLEDCVTLHGNQSADTLKHYYRNAHFLIFVSKSEGWPKVVAEAMCWGCLPITSNVSCVNYMIGDGKRGQITEPNVDDIVNKVKYYLNDSVIYERSRKNAMEWARRFTLEKFEEEVGKLLNG